ncbi:amylo-alpha-1,6-glucosidase [Edaphobacter aggregans]|uniref:amylo-alpha-1,6-glucosidase n=1 Tax=Edaphobacter aggregans TaxID=570835 RepID=UPI0012F906A2|nr:hypothetical protein [Edaphobacter aggregans]
MIRSLVIVLLLGSLSSAQLPKPVTSAANGRLVPDLPAWSTTLTQPNRYLSAHGLRAFAGGYSEDGLEFWSFPLQLVHGYHLSFEVPEAAPLAALSMLTSVEVDPLGVTRVYTATDFRVRERITTHAEDPGVLVLFTVEGRRDVRIQVHFQPSLNLMWPAGIGGQETAWDTDARGFLLSEPTHQFRALIASPEATEHSETNNDRRNSAFDRSLVLTLDPRLCSAGQCATLVFAGQSETREDVHTTAALLLHAADAPGHSDMERFASSDIVKVTTPDPDANRAIRWAQIALEQAWTCNPRLGCATVAGYGPSHGSRRPQYAWYFAGDGLLATEALLHEGDFKRAAAELDFLFRYQNAQNGMMWHEISQSAGFLNWAKDYPYMYAHVDITFDFLTVLAEYVRTTGDEAFIRQHWATTLQAYKYCLSTLDAGDGLPRVPADKMSGNEQDRLTDELTLSAAWVRAAHGMSLLAASMHDAALTQQAEAASLRARNSIQTRYWNPAAHRWVSGFMRSGAVAESTSGAELAAISSGAATSEQTSAILDALATPAYLTAWGLRSKPSTASDYDPTSYSKGSVWSHHTAMAAEVMWQSRRSDTANLLWQSLIPWASADSLGHMHEVMSGSFFTPQRESVPEQTWSSAAFLSAAINGMLGLESDGRIGVLQFAPQVPPSWNSLRVKHIRVGKSDVDLDWHSQNGSFTLEVRNAGPQFHLRWMQGRTGHDATAPAPIERDIMPGTTRLSIP